MYWPCTSPHRQTKIDQSDTDTPFESTRVSKEGVSDPHLAFLGTALPNPLHLHTAEEVGWMKEVRKGSLLAVCRVFLISRSCLQFKLLASGGTQAQSCAIH